ncbi:MAG TPA: hypothetical protein VGI78_21765, partial [Acetobacteraceae bacterium]
SPHGVALSVLLLWPGLRGGWLIDLALSRFHYSNTFTVLDSSQSVLVTPAAIAGVQRSGWWMRTELQCIVWIATECRWCGKN